MKQVSAGDIIPLRRPVDTGVILSIEFLNVVLGLVYVYFS